MKRRQGKFHSAKVVGRCAYFHNVRHASGIFPNLPPGRYAVVPCTYVPSPVRVESCACRAIISFPTSFATFKGCGRVRASQSRTPYAYRLSISFSWSHAKLMKLIECLQVDGSNHLYAIRLCLMGDLSDLPMLSLSCMIVFVIAGDGAFRAGGDV